MFARKPPPPPSLPFPTSPYSSSLYTLRAAATAPRLKPVAAMTPASTSPLAAAVLPTSLSSFSRCPPRRLPRISCLAAPERGGGNASNASPAPQQQPRWRAAVSAALAAAVVAASMPAYADLNRFEAEQRGEFGIGSAAQFGSADLKYASTSVSCFSMIFLLLHCLADLLFFSLSGLTGRLSTLTRTSGGFLISPVPS